MEAIFMFNEVVCVLPQLIWEVLENYKDLVIAFICFFSFLK